MAGLVASILVALAAAPTRAESSAPLVEAVWPQPAAVGELVTLQGRGFAAEPGANTVRFGGVVARVLDVDGGRLLVRVPEVADRAPVTVETRSGRSPGVPFTVLPRVALHPPEAPAPGATATLTMQVVGSEEALPVEVYSLEPGTATLEGEVVAVRETSGGRENSATVSLVGVGEGAPRLYARVFRQSPRLDCLRRVAPDPEAAPEIWEVSPPSASPGDPVWIRGRNLPESPEEAAVTVGDKPCRVLSTGPTDLYAVLPETAASGGLTVARRAPDGRSSTSNAFPFQVTPYVSLAADRLDLRKGQTATVTATVVGSERPMDLVAVAPTPLVATLEGGRRSRTLTTGGGEPNRTSFKVQGVRRGRFEVMVRIASEPGDTARVQPGEELLRSAPGGEAPVEISEVRQNGETSPLSPQAASWQVVPEGLGEVTDAGTFRAGGEVACGVLVGEVPGAPSFVIPVEIGGGLLFDVDDGCEWRKICVDVFVVARPAGDGSYDVGPAFERRPSYISSAYRASTVSLPGGAFTQAGGALADISSLEGASTLVGNVRNMLGRVSRIWAPCCVWFSLHKVYAVDPAKAQVSRDGSKLSAWVTTDEDGDTGMDGNRTEQTAEGPTSLLLGMRRFVERFSGLEGDRCLKMLIASGFQGEGGLAGKGEDKGEYAAFAQGRLSPQRSGFVPAHEVGHNLLGPEHWEGETARGELNVMAERERLEGNPTVVVDPEQCKKAKERIETLGTEEAPPTEEPAGDEGRGEEPPPSGPGEGGGSEEGAAPGEPSAPGEQPEPEEPNGECPCGQASAETQGLAALRNLSTSDEKTATGEATFTTCCAQVRFRVELTRKSASSWDYEWQLELIRKRPDCFVRFELDRYYNSKPFEYYIGGGSAEQAVQVSAVSFEEVGEGTSRLDGESGFTRDYSHHKLLSEGQLDPQSDSSLNRAKHLSSWTVLLGGRIVCKDGEEERSFPFHVVFRKTGRGEVELAAVKGVLPEEGAPRRLVERTIFHTP